MNAKIDRSNTVLSTDFGRGEITGIREKFDGKEDYYIVECGGAKLKNYIPVKNVKSFRHLSTKEEIESAMNGFTEQGQDELDFPSKKDRLNYFKEAFKRHEMSSIVRVVGELSRFDDLGTIESKLLDKLIDTLVIEISLVFGINEVEAKQILKQRLSL